MRHCVVVPVYNSPYLGEVIDEVLSLGYELIVVDDGSTMHYELQEHDTLHFLRHKENLGKGAAIYSGASKAKELGFKTFATMDADKQHYAGELEKLFAFEDESAIIIGNRDFESEHVPGSSKFGRKFSNFWVNVETGKKLGDTQSGFRRYPVSILELNPSTRRYDFEIEILVRHLWKKRPVYETEILCYYPEPTERISFFDKYRDNVRLSKLHTRLTLMRCLFGPLAKLREVFCLDRGKL